jgi:DnaK suppressor protein
VTSVRVQHQITMDTHAHEPRSPVPQATLDRLRLRLEHERIRLTEQIRKLGGGREIPDGGDPGDDGDLAVRFGEPEVENRLHRQYQETLRAIDAAIERMEAGSYGINLRTGEVIPVERLEAMPWATE